MKYHFLLLLPFFVVGACSSGNDAPSSESAKKEATSQTQAPANQAAPQEVSSDNPFSTQLNTLESAKQVSGAASSTIDKQQQELDNSTP